MYAMEDFGAQLAGELRKDLAVIDTTRGIPLRRRLVDLVCGTTLDTRRCTSAASSLSGERCHYYARNHATVTAVRNASDNALDSGKRMRARALRTALLTSACTRVLDAGALLRTSRQWSLALILKAFEKLVMRAIDSRFSAEWLWLCIVIDETNLQCTQCSTVSEKSARI
jgi:hypothetical protein